ncbi:MAG TPA: DUF3090 domain-containing protein [Actinomycetota bacterium]|nr:DUF3090 domain-containing protein [Actinomycetota bacterium]
MPSRDLDPVTRLTADAVGTPGQRTFYLQAASGPDQVTLLVEKEQVRRLAESLQSWLPELAADRPEDPDEARVAEAGELALSEPLEPDFRVGQLSLSYDPERDRVVVVATELVAGDDEPEELAPEPAPEPQEVRLFVTRPQLRVLARHGSQVVARGRPLCPLCGNPLDPSGHICPALNGHRPTAT